MTKINAARAAKPEYENPPYGCVPGDSVSPSTRRHATYRLELLATLGWAVLHLLTLRDLQVVHFSFEFALADRGRETLKTAITKLSTIDRISSGTRRRCKGGVVRLHFLNLVFPKHLCISKTRLSQ